MTGHPPRRALISGGTSGIGYACAEHLVNRGDAVWVLGSSADGVASARERIALAGASVCDVSVEGEVEAAVACARAAMGGIDGVFVNAGTDGEGLAAAELDVGHFRRLLDVNVIGAFLVARAALRVSPDLGRSSSTPRSTPCGPSSTSWTTTPAKRRW